MLDDVSADALKMRVVSMQNLEGQRKTTTDLIEEMPVSLLVLKLGTG